MLTRRDQVQAYRFAQARVQAALLSGQPDRVDVPMRRQRIAGFVGAMIAVLVVCGFGIYGLVRPGGKEGWRARDTLVVEKETGARYVYDPGDGRLHPVLNYASARLILGAEHVAVRQFSTASLAGAPRGAARGLAGLPDAVPAPGRLLTGPWLMCSGSVPQGDPWSTLSLGEAASGQRLGPDRALLVELQAGRQYLIWNDTRLEVRESVLTVLGLGGGTATTVTPEWLNSAVEPGPDLAAPDVPQAGARARYAVGTQPVAVGQVLSVQAAGGVRNQYYLVLPDGLAPVRDVATALLLADPRLTVAYGGSPQQALQRTAADVAAAPLSRAKVVPDGFPETVPQLVEPAPTADGARVVCSAYTDTTGRSVQSAVYVGSAATPPAATAGTAGAASGPRRAVVPPGRAALVRLLPHPRVRTDSVFVVTDTGIKYPAPSADALRFLGLGGVEPVPVPSGIVDAIPTGPALDPARANADVPTPRPPSDGLAALPTSALPPSGSSRTSPSATATTTTKPPRKKVTPTKRKPRPTTSSASAPEG